MDAIETREAIRALTGSVKALAQYALGLHRQLVALRETLESRDAGLHEALLTDSDATRGFPTIEQLIGNIDALLQQLN